MDTGTPKILVILTWFGVWPGWIRPFMESCRWNPTIDWLIATDCGHLDDLPPNVRLLHTSFADYRALIANRLQIEPLWHEPYKLCDLKPALGFIHSDFAQSYHYVGFGDLDVIYGDIRAIYTSDVLVHDLISSHGHIVAGHFTLLANNPRMTNAFKCIWGWRELLADAAHRSFDEQVFSRLFMPINKRRPWQRLRAPYLGGASLVEQFSTDIAPIRWVDGSRDYPNEWLWQAGKLTNDRTGDREFLYLHLSHWQSNRWTSEAQAPWQALAHIDQLPAGRPQAFRISRAGICPLAGALAPVQLAG